MKQNSISSGQDQFTASQPLSLSLASRFSEAAGFVRARKTVSTVLSVALLLLAGCQTPTRPDYSAFTPGPVTPPSAIMTLREGDMVKISFAAAPHLDTTQQIRRDGKIELPLVGEVTAAGKTPGELEKQVIELYAPQLNSKEITVSLESASFPVFVTGCVIKPGKVLSDHPITALEAVMEAGGFDYSKANLKSVRIIRRDGNAVKHFTLNLKAVMNGTENSAFPLKPDDILYVPERFTWF